MLVTPGLHAWDAMRRRGATSEARSEPTGRATHLLLHQDTLCCTPPGRERSAASRHWLLLHPLVKSLPFSNYFKSWFAQGLVVPKIEQLLLHNRTDKIRTIEVVRPLTWNLNMRRLLEFELITMPSVLISIIHHTFHPGRITKFTLLAS